MTKQGIHLYLAGDSTVQTYEKDRAPQAGWGQFLGQYFTEEVQIHNHAIGGRSTKTFITEGRLDKIIEEIEAGDYLLIQMGHNDSTKSRPERYTEPYEDYKDYLYQYIDRARGKCAYPILITPVGRLRYVNEEFLKDFGDYCHAMKEVAAEKQVPLIDLMDKSIQYYTSVGYDEVVGMFMISVDGEDCTHFTEQGAKVIAQLVSQGIKELSIELSAYVK